MKNINSEQNKTVDKFGFSEWQSEKHVKGVGTSPLDEPYTPDEISVLGPRDIFVFGSNLAGQHGGGAARVAFNRFGAIWGEGEGLQGNSYAIPTMQGGVETIRPYVDRFIEVARENKDLTFYVTKIGCGIAGFSVSEIAPLFRNAIDIPNIRLPREFVEIISNDRVKPSADFDMMVHTHGVTRTFADLVIAKNEREKFTSPTQVVNYISDYFERFIKTGDDVAFIAVRMLWNIINTPEMFAGNILDVEKFRGYMLDLESHAWALDIAYELYCREKLYNLVVYLNGFRRYTTPKEIWNDLHKSGILNFSHCGPNSDPFYTMSPIGAGHRYPVIFFMRFIRENWDAIAPDGTLDARLLDNLMFGEHERALRELGLDAVISRDYRSDAPCHPEVYFPKKPATGPVYVMDQENRRYNRSCGEGKGPNAIPDFLEYRIAARLLKYDARYEHLGDYLVPKSDLSLPILSYYEGLILIQDPEEKKSFIENLRSSFGW